MNNLTSRQRKLAYAAGILLLLFPIVILGAPAAKDVGVDDKSLSGGSGLLARMRVEHDLGEATLGNVDPSSAAMNLVLLGLRGPAAGLLHLQAIDYQERKDWAKLAATVDSITLLQPHYVQIWKFQGWNLAYNVSREWDKVDDRFYWVKQGVKFLQEGTRKNQTIAILYHTVGENITKKMNTSDEKKFFREFFVKDPDTEKFDGGADSEINPSGSDSNLVAYEWFTTANEKDDAFGMTGMTHVFFRQGPSKARLTYAEMRQKDGYFDQENRAAWEAGYDEWMNVYGVYEFKGLNEWKYKLNSTPEDIVVMARENGISVDEQREVHSRNVNMVHYRFWADYADAERDEETMVAHRTTYEAKRAFLEGRGFNSVDAEGKTTISEAQQKLEEAMGLWIRVFEKYPNMLTNNDSYREEALSIVHYWYVVHETNGTTPADTFPLKSLWDSHPEVRPEIQRQFLLDTMRAKRNN